MKKIVIALGGNALQEAGKPATAEAQLEVVEKTSEYIADIIGHYCPRKRPSGRPHSAPERVCHPCKPGNAL